MAVIAACSAFNSNAFSDVKESAVLSIDVIFYVTFVLEGPLDNKYLMCATKNNKSTKPTKTTLSR